jgi:hypothetical protein
LYFIGMMNPVNKQLIIKNFYNCIGFGLKDFDVLRYKVLILLKTRLHTYLQN